MKTVQSLPTAVGGSFKSHLQTMPRQSWPQSHQRAVGGCVQVQPNPLKNRSIYHLHLNTLQAYSQSMYLTPYTSLSWAFQLHYYLCFRTHRRRQLFDSNENEGFIAEICERHEYHLLDWQRYRDQWRCLLSLLPNQNIAKTVQTLKANSSRELVHRFGRGDTSRAALAKSG